MNDEAQNESGNVPDVPDENATDNTPVTSTASAVSATPEMEVASQGLSAEPGSVEAASADVPSNAESAASDAVANVEAPASDAIEQAVDQTNQTPQADQADAATASTPEMIEVVEAVNETQPETATESLTRAEIEDPRAVAQAVSQDIAPEPEAAEVAEAASADAATDALDTAAPEPDVVPADAAEAGIEGSPEAAATPAIEPISEATIAEASQAAEETAPATETVAEMPVETQDPAAATEAGTLGAGADSTDSADAVDDNFILEKVAEAKAAKKKKTTTPRPRKPSKRAKEKLPDLGDGSGYEPPDTVAAASAEAMESADGTTTETEEEALWYAVHCYSGYENKVKHSLEQRIETMGMAGRILEVVVPTEEEIEVRDGKRKTVERRVFPGYVLVRMRMSEDSWHVVRNTPGVTRFIGMGNRPQPLSPQEVNQILRRMEAEAPKIKVSFKVGQKVRITDGPFADFMGLVDKIDTERAKVAVLVSFFGRETPVELDFLQVEKM